MRDPSSSDSQIISLRIKIVSVIIYGLLITILVRLYYWQIIMGDSLQIAAQRQSQRIVQIQGNRGQILTSDGHLLASNQKQYRLILEPEKTEQPLEEIVDALLPSLIKANQVIEESANSEEKQQRIQEFKEQLLTKAQQSGKWIRIYSNISQQIFEEINQLDLAGLNWETYSSRFYPEASMAAHVLGFVGKNDQGEDVGYFGIEGALNEELSGKLNRKLLNTDALGFLLVSIDQPWEKPLDGRDVILTLRRDLQFLAESSLKRGLEQYGARAGEVIIMEPVTGKILALATLPTYDLNKYFEADTALFKNPALVNTFEPGSIFKTLTVAAGIDTGAVTPETKCPNCSQPRVIGQYTIRTWNDEYNPNITVNEALAKSDNIAMIFVGESLGKDKFIDYIKKFGIGDEIKIDLQDDTTTPFPKKWGPVELATISFGQGISTNSLQMVRAVGAIANQGKLMRPTILERVIDHQTNQQIEVKPVVERQVISSDTASTVAMMMMNSAHHGEAQWTASKRYLIAGKTGTSQVAVEGGYAKDKTIVSFIGFAPVNEPKFIMMVKLNEPSSSPWAAETAAPLWYQIADKLFLLMNIPPDNPN